MFDISSLSLVAWLLVATGWVFRSGRKVWTKWFQDEKHSGCWRKKTAALTSLQMTTASVTFFVWAYISGGTGITTGWLEYYLFVIAAGILSIFNMFFRTHLQGLKGVTLAAPLEGLVPVGAMIVSVGFGRDLPLNHWGLAGVLCMASGVYFLHVEKALAREDKNIAGSRFTKEGSNWFLLKLWRYIATPFIAIRQNPALFAAVMMVVLSSVGVNLDARLARTGNVPWGLAWVCLFAAAGNFVLALKKAEFSELSMRQILWAALPGTLFALGNGVTSHAYRMANTSIVAAMKRGDVILTVIGGRYINKEREEFTGRLIGGLLIATGAALITLAINRSS